MDDIYDELRRCIQKLASKNEYRHPYCNDLNLHNYHPHIFPYQHLHPFYYSNKKEYK